MYLYNYLVCVIAQVILAAIVWHRAYMDERKNKLYLLAIVFNTLTLTGYIGRGLVDGSSLVLLNTLSNLLIYTSSSLAAFFLLLTSLKKDTAIYRTVLVIETVVLLIIVSSPWTKLAFSINEYGLYERGLAYSALSVFDTAYVVLWLGCLAVTYQYVEWKKRAYILLLAALEIAAIIIQIFTSEFKVIHVAAAFLLSIYYAFIMEVEGRYDQMTGVYSKRFYRLISKKTPNLCRREMNWRSAMKKITWYNKYSGIEL